MCISILFIEFCMSEKKTVFWNHNIGLIMQINTLHKLYFLTSVNKTDIKYIQNNVI